MAKAYRQVPREEEAEPLTGHDEGVDVNEKWAWESGRKSLPEKIMMRLSRLSPHWAWLAHAVLLSVSLTFFALSFCVKTAKNPAAPPNPIPTTYCT